MNAKQHKGAGFWMMTSLAVLGAALAGCGGAVPSAKDGGYAPHGSDGPATAAEPQGAPGYAPLPPPPAEAEESGAFDAADAAPPAAGRASESRSRDDADPFQLTPQTNRPGLATQWGEQRFSRVTTAPFVRADADSPFAVSKLFYNDPQGIAAMSDTLGGARQHLRRFSVGGGHVELGLRDGSGRFLTGFSAHGDNFVTGSHGQRYSIFIKNHSPGRLEAVVSVDGLDVIDGKPASFAKRGYLIDPFSDLEIEGFRTSTNEVAAFRFGSVRDSYANKKHGDTRNVGVIGLALFHERGDSPRFWGTPRSHDDVVQRSSADPFPNRFAAPPN